MPPDPPTAFHFAVRFVGQGADVDASFQEVSGIGPEMQTEPYHEGGENRFQHQLPKGVKHPRLTLKRGIAPIDSKLVAWCRDTLEGGLAVTVKPASGVEVLLLDGDGNPLRQWTFTNAYPVRWTVDPFVSTKNELAIEKIELAYAESQRKK
jgi:phage tail-like protein